MEAPIPPPLPDDEEDVSWALSTSNALWGRGERAEALKWLRRAAEHASDVNADARALHLFKAAADISTRLSNPPAPPSVPAPSASEAPSKAPPPRSGSSAPPLPPAASRQSALMNATLPSATARQLGARLEPAPPPQRRLPTAKPPLSPRSPQPAGQGAVRVTHARTMQSPDAEALAVTIRQEPASEAAPRQGAGRGAPPTSPARSSDSRAPAREAAEEKPEPKPIGRRRNGDSGRKKTVDERLKREGSQPAAPSRVRLAPKNERFTPDDEVTQTRSAASLVEAATAAAAALGKYDDLDETTSVLAGRSVVVDSVMSASVEAELDRAIEDLAGAPETVVDHTTEDNTDAASATEAGFAWTHATYDGPGPDPRRGEGASRDAPVAAVGALSVAVPSTERAAPIPVLAAVRVAVLPGSAPGEARLVVLDGVETPPAGAVHAVLLPLTSADGASILRLLGG